MKPARNSSRNSKKTRASNRFAILKNPVEHFLTPPPQEFEKIADDANVYKLVGPVLLKQDRSEAVLAVNGRLEFIEKEM